MSMKPRRLTLAGFCHARRLTVDLHMDARLRASQAAAEVGVSKQAFNYWRRQGKITPVAHDRAGRALYRLRDVLIVERDTRQAKQSSRTVNCG